MGAGGSGADFETEATGDLFPRITRHTQLREEGPEKGEESFQSLCLSAGLPMAFASIFVPNFMLQAVVRAEPALRERALALIDGNPPLCSVVAINEKAAQAGIELRDDENERGAIRRLGNASPFPAAGKNRPRGIA